VLLGWLLLLLPGGWLLLLRQHVASVGEGLLQLAAAGWVGPGEVASGLELLLVVGLLVAAATCWGLAGDRQPNAAAP
jgi:hypothetical protein